MKLETKNLNVLKLVNALKGSRQNNRNKLIEELSFKFLELSKDKNLIGFSRQQINDLLENVKLSNSQIDRTTTEILSFMLSKNLIQENIRVKAVYSFRNKPLSSYDYGSYAIMMNKNGYKTKIYKWVNNDILLTNGKIKQFPIKKLLATIGINEKIPEDINDYDEIEQKSEYSKSNQGIYTNSNLSLIRDFCYYSEKKVYSIV